MCENSGSVSPGLDKIFLKSQTDIFGCDYLVSVMTTQLYYCSSKAAMDNMQTNGHLFCINKIFQ